MADDFIDWPDAFASKLGSYSDQRRMSSHHPPVGAAEGCDLLTLIFQDQKIAACRSSYTGQWRMRILRSNTNPVRAWLASEGGFMAGIFIDWPNAFASKLGSYSDQRRMSSHHPFVGAAAGCDPLTLMFQDQKIAACRVNGEWDSAFQHKSL